MLNPLGSKYISIPDFDVKQSITTSFHSDMFNYFENLPRGALATAVPEGRARGEQGEGDLSTHADIHSSSCLRRSKPRRPAQERSSGRWVRC